MPNRSRIAWTSAFLSLALLVSACSGKENGENAENSPSPSAAASSNEGSAPAASGSTADDDLFLGKYDPPIEVSTVRVLGGDVKFFEGESIDNNVWTRYAKDQLGITIKNKWTVNSDQGKEKMNLSIVSGDLPDFYSVDATQLHQLYEAGEIMDLTDLYDKYAMPAVKQYTEALTNGLNLVTFDGKMMSLPGGSATSDSSPMLWIRKDWLIKLNLPEPKTMADVLAISKAFTTQDPDGNGKPDTFGLAMNKTLLLTNGGDAFGSLEGFFNGYHAYPQNWVKDKDGKLVYGSIQPEMKAALTQLQTMYKDGELDKEFGVKNETKEAELVAAGKIGMTYGLMYHTLGQLGDSRKNDPNADWQPYPIVSIDDSPANPQTAASSIGSYYVVNKKAKHPEAFFKLANLSVDMDSKPKEFSAAYNEVDGIQVWQYFPITLGNPNQNLTAYHKVIAALDSKDTTGFSAQQLDAYNKSLAVAQGSTDVTDWGFDKVFGKDSSYKVIDKYVTENLLKPSDYIYGPTETMTAKNATLQKMEIETYTKIIMGEPIALFDKFVSDWKKLGGDQITAEVNAASK
ncbi:extracellular solute-binding protein [Cohnella hashimotonis]|uniref:Extracellular solute-binding protein n=1 Tax=Cohnella hashimotonis TaxID=2826895 RepID=A0ABT6TKR4_9BACL|nr:extracellular solute-binding protein [Cohnella hashimotonis]MDI4647448.1 extracellular solute-binding protein [Cohnella hashimotonis]